MGGTINQLPFGEKVSDSIIQFYKPKIPVRLEVVFFHGLEHGNICGDAYWKTWLTRDGIPGNVWPMTWLPAEFPFAQVFALSYDASIKQTATDGRMDLYIVGEKLVQEMVHLGRIGQTGVPVVFVCHGFGGLVAKQIVVSGKHRFSQDNKVQNLLQTIDAFFFYSTPHYGSHLAESPSYLYYTKGGAKGPLLENFEVLNTEISRLNYEFEQSKHQSWRFYVVAETHETSQYGEMVVPEASSRYENANYLALNVDHSDICKPQTKTDSSYQWLTKCLREVLARDVVHLPSAVESVIFESLVGLEKQVEHIKRMLQEVSIVGLVGMGGSGKTTLAKVVYQSTCKDYEKSSYLDAVKSKATLDEVLIMLLRQFGIKNKKTGGIAKQSDFKDPEQSYLEDLKVFVKEHKVLVVVDDVGTEANFDHLLKDMDFSNGNKDSKMIVTCRNWQFLKKQTPMVGKYEMVLLNALSQDIELFSYHAFKGARTIEQRRKAILDLLSKDSSEHLMVDFESLCDEAVKACGGLPLSLEVMGSCLGGYLRDGDISSVKCLEYWRGALDKLKCAEPLEGEAENERLWKALHISFHVLHENEQKMFLDIACFFCGSLRYDEHTLLRIWGGEPSKAVELLNLKERSLVKVNQEDGIVIMHDQLRDMGQRIVKDQGRGALENMTRLWEYKDVSKFLHNKEPTSIQGLSLEKWRKASKRYKKIKTYDIFTKFLFIVCKLNRYILNCPNLRLLALQEVKMTTLEAISFKNSSSLQWLCLKGSNITKIPKFVWNCRELCVLDMRDCTYLNKLQKFIGNLVNLLELDLSNCDGLTSLPQSIGNLVNLLELDLHDCNGLTSLPQSIGNLVNLSELDLSKCNGLTSLPQSIDNLVKLLKLHLRGCDGLTSLPQSIGNLVNLVKLDLSKCNGLTSLPQSIGNLVNLSELDLSRCNGLTSLPQSIGNLVNLVVLDLCGCNGLTSLPQSIGNLVNLVVLDLCGCEWLTSPPQSIGNLVNLVKLDLSKCNGLRSLPQSIGNLVNLSELDLSRCNGLTSLPQSIGNLVNLMELDLRGCNGLTSLPQSIGNLVNLVELDLCGCNGLTSLPQSIDNLVKLLKLHLRSCYGLTSLPQSIGNLVKLLKLDLCGCNRLISLPQSIGNLVNLLKLNLFSCNGLTSLPQSIGNLVNLSELHLSYCDGLTSLPQSIGNLVKLLKLDLCGCHGLTSLPQSIGNLVNLVKLDLSKCNGLTSLPQSIGNLVKLLKLDLCGCRGLTSLPQSIGNLVNLVKLDLSDCNGLTSLPQSIGNLVNK